MNVERDRRVNNRQFLNGTLTGLVNTRALSVSGKRTVGNYTILLPFPQLKNSVNRVAHSIIYCVIDVYSLRSIKRGKGVRSALLIILYLLCKIRTKRRVYVIGNGELLVFK